jgi:hypothetical protein
VVGFVDFPDPTIRAACEGEKSDVIRTVLALLFWCPEIPVKDGAIEILGCRRAIVRGFVIEIQRRENTRGGSVEIEKIG